MNKFCTINSLHPALIRTKSVSFSVEYANEPTGSLLKDLNISELVG